ncbi:hypothetical protein PC116_g8332 [Phytophthora cactorum]|uniref:Uncharacterized protein n=1 Tax=Phytophthora cactorum TaxID=29920 RepID=A0A329SXI1_9STRA|nr:hypothetical protein Pcac1_g12437 [Phytophthora cactorum]KAG2941071.1 hypothetical protein PC117_g10335 [Phytophthora cactorum]KAG2983905.1 hypothetical protein PC118_g9148 [Phytophthora cactorum]KAG3020272.1 hypothetical protein PC119_g10028 [Phytophthora cactorum]KAG3033547.1 hypothetical protein PC120_g1833 [Phytophthora cactorum]
MFDKARLPSCWYFLLNGELEAILEIFREDVDQEVQAGMVECVLSSSRFGEPDEQPAQTLQPIAQRGIFRRTSKRHAVHPFIEGQSRGNIRLLADISNRRARAPNHSPAQTPSDHEPDSESDSDTEGFEDSEDSEAGNSSPILSIASVSPEY